MSYANCSVCFNFTSVRGGALRFPYSKKQASSYSGLRKALLSERQTFNEQLSERVEIHGKRQEQVAMAGKSERFTAYVYENDYTEIQKLVQQYPNIETGGDLFGLWQDDKSVVIQLFIGPGKGCKRTTTSFHQDVAYLQKVGTVITKEEGLCNVGEWHSHHQIGMPKPSGADKRTVLSNMPQLGLDRFVLFIASIENSEKKKRPHSIQPKDITLRCFMFREDLHHEEQPIEGKIVQIEEKNPVHLKYKARKQIKEGAEEPPPKEEALEKKRKQSKKQELLDSKTPAGNQSGQRDENRSPNTGWKEKPSDQRTTDVPRQTTQSYSQKKGRSNEGQRTSGQSLNPTAVPVADINATGFF